MMLTPEDAWSAIENRLEKLPIEDTPRLEATGRTLAGSLHATVDMPQADVSAMDGYVFAGEVPSGEPLPVVATAAAGSPLGLHLEPGEAAKIMTGAVVPSGGDRVIPVEATDGGNETVVLSRVPDPGAHIRRQGEVIRHGDPLMPAGRLLTPGAISLLASHGFSTVPTHTLPKVAVMTTGDEVIPPEVEPAAGQLRDSNTSFLLAAGQVSSLEFHSLGTATDRLEDLRRRIRDGLKFDVLLLCGGVSMGEYDLVEDVLAELGCTLLFDRVAIQPGKPVVAARHNSGWVFGLPGNPASVMVTYWLFVKPVLDRLQGLPGRFWHGALKAELTEPLPGSKGRDRFLPAEVQFTEGGIRATPFAPEGSHDVASYGRGTAIVRIRPNAPPAQVGDLCEVLPLANWLGGER